MCEFFPAPASCRLQRMAGCTNPVDYSMQVGSVSLLGVCWGSVRLLLGCASSVPNELECILEEYS